MLPEFQPIFVKAVGKMGCIFRHKIGVCLIITSLNWHAVKDSRVDFSQCRGSNHLVIIPDGPREQSWLSAVSRAFSFKEKLLHSKELKRVA